MELFSSMTLNPNIILLLWPLCDSANPYFKSVYSNSKMQNILCVMIMKYLKIGIGRLSNSISVWLGTSLLNLLDSK